jgi:hypothetical protein
MRKWRISASKKKIILFFLTMHAIVILFQVYYGIYYFIDDYLARHSKCGVGELVVHIIF